MNILIVTPNYPDRKSSNYPFVKQIVDQFAVLGHQCCVVAPYNVTRNKHFYPFKDGYTVESGKMVEVLRPNYLSFTERTFAGFSPTTFFRRQAQRRAFRQLPFKPDVVYCHFWKTGHDAYSYAKENGIPLFVASGESEIPQEESSPNYQDFYNYVKGVICVSSKNKEESIQMGLATENKCVVIPNAINSNLFCKKSKQKCREILGLPQDVFISIFVGWFNERKGVNRVAEAINSIQGTPVYSMFIGGENDIDCKNILKKGRVKHEEIPTYLNAADIFVLPTLHEGCCNAVIEAMACGLPVVSSDLPFNWDVLDNTNSILINPRDIGQIADAIMKLRDDKTSREQLSNGAIKTAGNLTIEKRAEAILTFIRERI
jgi:glycosyltransferase involved in cell wall biosynthesis